VEELTLEVPLALPAQGAVVVQLSVAAPDDSGRRSLTLHARAEDAAPDALWSRHATGVLAPGAPEATPLDRALHSWPPHGATAVPLAGLYERLADAGLAYGAPFQGLRAVWQRGDELFAEVELADTAARDAARFALHPALFDAALHALTVESIH